MAEQFPGDSGNKIREVDDRKRTDNSDGHGSRSSTEQDATPDIANLARLSSHGFRTLQEKQTSAEKQIIDLGNKLKYDDDKRASELQEVILQRMQSFTYEILNAVQRAKPEPYQFADIWKQDISKVNEQLVTVFTALNQFIKDAQREQPAQQQQQQPQQQQQQQQQQGGGSDKYLLKMNELAKEIFALRVEREYEKLGVRDTKVDIAWNDRWNILKLEASSFVQLSNSDVTAVFDRTCKDLLADLKSLPQTSGGFWTSRKPTDLILAINWADYQSRFTSSNKSESVPPRKETKVADPPDTYPNASSTSSSSAVSSVTSSARPPNNAYGSSATNAYGSSATNAYGSSATNAYGYLTTNPYPPNSAYGIAYAHKAAAAPQFNVYYDLDEREVIGLADFIGKNLQGPLKKITDAVLIEKPCAVVTFVVVHDRIDVSKWKPLWADRQLRSENRHVLVLVYNNANAAPSPSQYSGWIPEFASVITVTPFMVQFDSTGTGKPPKHLFLPKESSACFSAIDSFIRPFRTQSQR